MCRGVVCGELTESMDEEPQVRGFYNITYLYTNQPRNSVGSPLR